MFVGAGAVSHLTKFSFTFCTQNIESEESNHEIYRRAETKDRSIFFLFSYFHERKSNSISQWVLEMNRFAIFVCQFSTRPASFRIRCIVIWLYLKVGTLKKLEKNFSEHIVVRSRTQFVCSAVSICKCLCVFRILLCFVFSWVLSIAYSKWVFHLTLSYILLISKCISITVRPAEQQRHWKTFF